MTVEGDPARFLAWVQDSGEGPVSLSADAPAWEQLVHDALAYSERNRQRSVGDAAAAQLACREGCAWCCFIPVTTTGPEVDLAWRYAREHLSETELGTVRMRAASEPGEQLEPCPFLIGDRCGVYPVRPLACRAWNSTDATACQRAHELGHDRVPIPVQTVVRGVFANAAQALARGIAERGGEPAVSLRTALHQRLEAREEPPCREPPG